MKTDSVMFKLVVPVLAFVLLAGLATDLVAQRLIGQSLDLALRDKGSAIARQIAVTSSRDLLLEDRKQLQRILDDEKESVSDLSYAFILDENDNIMAHTFETGVPLQLLWENNLPAAQETGTQLLEIDGELVYDFAVGIDVAGQYRIGTARLGISSGGLEAAQASLRTSSALITVFLVLAGLMLAFLLSASVVRPIRRLHRVSEQVAAGSYDSRFEWGQPDETGGPVRGDEIVELGQAFNHMLDQLREVNARLIRSEKLATIGQLASTIAHEIRNPLGVMKNVVYYLNMFDLGEQDAEIKENLDILAGEIDNSNKIVSDLLDFSRIKHPVLNPCSLNTILESALDRIPPHDSISVARDLDPDLPLIEVDGAQMHQVFYNIATNAFQAMEKGGTLTVASRIRGANAEISFQDTGTGIAEEDLARIFEPLFSSRARGTGLGLALVASLVEGHRGRIEVSSRLGEGSTFTVILPLERSQA